MGRDYWTERHSELVGAYLRHLQGIPAAVRFELVTRALIENLPPSNQHIVDIGGGFGLQAVRLARAGHTVVIVDSDSAALEAAQSMLSLEDDKVQQRVQLREGNGESAHSLLGVTFDVVCCHSVLMYHDNPEPLITSLARLARAGGIISILSINPHSLAMRSGLQRLWREAITSLETGTDGGERFAPSRAHDLEIICRHLRSCGAIAKTWYGVGIFSDHLEGEAIGFSDIDDIVALEWLAGSRDPYRSVARSFHLIAQKNS